MRGIIQIVVLFVNVVVLFSKKAKATKYLCAPLIQKQTYNSTSQLAVSFTYHNVFYSLYL